MKSYNFRKLGFGLVATLALCSCELFDAIESIFRIEAPRECYITCEGLGWHEKHCYERYLATLGLDDSVGTLKINLDGTLYFSYRAAFVLGDGEYLTIYIDANTGTQFELNRKYYFRKRFQQDEFYIQATASYVKHREEDIQMESFYATDGYFEITNVEYDGYGEYTCINGNFVFTAENKSLGKMVVSGGSFENQIVDDYNPGAIYELELTANTEVCEVGQPITFTVMQGKDEASMVDVTNTCVLYNALCYEAITNPFIPTEAGEYSFYAVKDKLVSPAIWVTVE